MHFHLTIITRQRSSGMNDFKNTIPKFATGRSPCAAANESLTKSWDMLVGALNLNGWHGNVEQWKKVCSDIRQWKRSKVNNIKEDHNRTGNITRDGDLPLSGNTRKVIAILGQANVEEVRDVANSLPDSAVHSLKKSMGCNESALFDEPEDDSILKQCAAAEPGIIKSIEKVISQIAKTAEQTGEVETEGAAAGPLLTCMAESNFNLRNMCDGRVLELLVEQNEILTTISSNGTKIIEFLRENSS